eukprot:maker-scaffold_20-snap-gene-5.12-mRNA-1 protein AED:0.10 eAED:0.10 QI:66/1/1/1/1/1/2/1137/234
MKKLIIFGSNTDIGKTVFSTLLVRSLLKQEKKVLFLKPFQTGSILGDSDENYIKSNTTTHTNLVSKTLFNYEEPVSPHIAAEKEKRVIKDEELIQTLSQTMESYAKTMDVCLVETAGGVLSPTAYGSLQADVYKKLFTEAVLIGDDKLGGISSTLAAYESLRNRKYNVKSILVLEKYADYEYGNVKFLKNCFPKRDFVHGFPSIPEDKTVSLTNWFAVDKVESLMNDIVDGLDL